MDPLIRSLLRPEAYDHPVTEFQLLETHISWVILTGDYVYKLKKPVDLGFVNFTTLERRRHYCEEEIRLNHRLAPELYLGVLPIYVSQGHATFHPAGEPVEYAVQMRQFPQADLLPNLLNRGTLEPGQIDRLADDIAAFHRLAAVATPKDPYGLPEGIRQDAIDNLDVLHKITDVKSQVDELRIWTETEFRRLETWFEQRHAQGHVRECHGDMHLGNMVMIQGSIRIFDCLEFSPKLRSTDVIAEIAFLVMDLMERGVPRLAVRLLNRWLEQTGDFDGLTGWRWYFVYRALVRAKVTALRLQQDDITADEAMAKQRDLHTYLQLAREWTQPHRSSIIVTCGLSGCGKSTVSAALCDDLLAIRVRSDVERKRLFGRWGDASALRLTGEMYTPGVTDTVYRDVLARHVPPILAAGFTTIVDATCLRRWQRQLFIELARQRMVDCVILDLQASLETLQKRIQQRQSLSNDPSDATLAVLEQQHSTRETLTADELDLTISINMESSEWHDELQQQLQRRGILQLENQRR